MLHFVSTNWLLFLVNDELDAVSFSFVGRRRHDLVLRLDVVLAVGALAVIRIEIQSWVIPR